MQKSWFTGVVLIASLATACGGSGKSASPDMLPAGNTIKIWVGEPVDPSSLTSAEQPLVGASVIVTPPGGGDFVIALTGADGSATYTGDFSKGAATVTIYKENYVAITTTGVTPDFVANSQVLAFFSHPGDLSFSTGKTTASATPPTTVALTGAIKNKAAATDNVTLTTTLGGTFQGTQSAYSLQVPTGMPLTIVGLDFSTVTAPARSFNQTFVKWFTIDQPAVTAATTLDIDVAAQTAIGADKIKSANLSITIPGGAAGPLGGTSTSYYESVSLAHSTFLGSPTLYGINADASAFTGSMQWAEALPAADVISFFYVAAADGSFSERLINGYPTGDVSLTDLPPAPQTTSLNVVTGDTIDVFGLSTTRQKGDLHLEVNDGAGNAYWVIFSPTDSITIPSVPSVVSGAFPSALKGNLVFIDVVTPGDQGLVRSRAYSHNLDVVLQ